MSARETRERESAAAATLVEEIRGVGTETDEALSDLEAALAKQREEALAEILSHLMTERRVYEGWFNRGYGRETTKFAIGPYDPSTGTLRFDDAPYRYVARPVGASLVAERRFKIDRSGRESPTGPCTRTFALKPGGVLKGLRRCGYEQGQTEDLWIDLGR